MIMGNSHIRIEHELTEFDVNISTTIVSREALPAEAYKEIGTLAEDLERAVRALRQALRPAQPPF